MTDDSPVIKDWNDSPTTIRYTSERTIDLRLIQSQLDEIEEVLLQTLRYPTFADHHLPLDRLIIMKQRYESALDTLIAVKLSFGMRSVLEPREEKPSALIEQSVKQSYDFILDVLRLQEEYECYGEPIYWALTGDYAPITFYVLCNDLFWWATADAQRLTQKDMPDLRQAIADVQETDVYTSRLDAYEVGCMLWCARKRKMRPQRPAYPGQYKQITALFDACGPERPPEDEG